MCLFDKKMIPAGKNPSKSPEPEGEGSEQKSPRERFELSIHRGTRFRAFWEKAPKNWDASCPKFPGVRTTRLCDLGVKTSVSQ